MDILTYLYPHEYVSQLIVLAQMTGFALWTLSLFWYLIRDIRIRRQIYRFDISELKMNSDGPESRNEENAVFGVGRKEETEGGSGLLRNKVLNQLLYAFRDSSTSGKPIDVAGLVKNTSSRLTANNSWLRSVLSLFIIVGLLGTLWGLASSLDQLSALSVNGEQVTNETLAQGLNNLLSKLGGAFAPSIWGVLFTVVGVLLFAAYVRAGSLPLIYALERRALTNWAPKLLGKGVDESVLMRENIKAAQQIGRAAENISEDVTKLVNTLSEDLPALVTNLTKGVSEISEKLSHEATELSEDVSNARSTLKTLTVASENLNKFSGTFQASVEKLYPFADATELRALYEGLLQRSSKILENQEIFQGKVLNEFSDIREQKTQLVAAVKTFELKVAQASNAIVDEMGGTSAAARDAFTRLSQQNADVIRELVNQVGTPVASALEPIPDTLERIGGEISRINAPLEGVKDSMTQSSYKVITYAEERMSRIEDKLQAQVTNLEGLSRSINGLVPAVETLSERIDGFNQKTNQFGKSLSEFDKKILSIDSQLDRFEQRAAEVIKETRVAATRSNGERGRTSPPAARAGIFGRIKNRFFGE